MSITLDSISSENASIEIKTAAGQALAIDGSGNITANQGGTWVIASVTADVNIADGGNSITVDASQLDIDDLNSADDSVEIKTAAGQALLIDGSGYITSNINGTVTVSASQLDIDDLNSADDNVEIKTAAGQALAIDGSGYITANQGGTWNIGTVASITADVSIDDGGNSITVDAVDLDIRNLVFATDKVDVSGSSIVTSPDAYDIWKATAQSVTATAALVAGTALSGRLNMIIQNLGSNDIYVGQVVGVTASTGLKIPKGSSMEMGYGASAAIYALTASGTSDIRVAEFAA